MSRFTKIELVPADEGGGFRGLEDVGIGEPVLFEAGFARFLIREAWHRGCDFEDLADGFGPGAGTHNDWSAIRDSTPMAIERMFERTLNYLFGATRR